MEKIKVYDGVLDHSEVRVEVASGDFVRFISARGGGQCFHIEDPKSAKKLRKLLKPLADLA